MLALGHLSPLPSWNEKSKNSIWATNARMTLVGVQLDTLVTYALAKDEANWPSRLEVTAFSNSLRDQVLL